MQSYLYDDLSEEDLHANKKGQAMKVTPFGAEFAEVERKESTVKLESICQFCGKTNVLELDAMTYDIGIAKIHAGAHVQHAFPMLNADQREFFLTGNCACIWGSADNEDEA